MLLLASTSLPEGGAWQYEIKLDGDRALAIKTPDGLLLRSRNDEDFSGKYPAVAAALSKLPSGTILDREIVAFDPVGRPSFNALQNFSNNSDWRQKGLIRAHAINDRTQFLFEHPGQIHPRSTSEESRNGTARCSVE